MSDELTLAQATVGIVTALPKEIAAVRMVFSPSVSAVGPSGTIYDLCAVPCVGGQIIVAMTQFLVMGNNLAAAQTTLMLRDCESIRHVVMVGIAGAIPCPEDASRHVRLGDIVVSGPHGVFQFDLGKQVQGKPFDYRSIPTKPSARLLTAINQLMSLEEINQQPWQSHIDQACRLFPEWRRPDLDTDILDDGGGAIPHPFDTNRRQEGFSRVFVGAIASSNTVLKDAEKRNAIVAAALGAGRVLCCVEMEGAGVQDATWLDDDAGYLIVRGTCDYCNAKKNDLWQKYAALIASAFAKSVVEALPSPPRSSSSPSIPPAPCVPVLQSFGDISGSHITVVNINNSKVHLQFGLPINARSCSREMPYSGYTFAAKDQKQSDDGVKEKFRQFLMGIQNVFHRFVPKNRTQMADDLKGKVQRYVMDIRHALAVWSFEQAEKAATDFELLLVGYDNTLSDVTVLDGTILAARAHINKAETKGLGAARYVGRAKALLRQVERRLGSTDPERLAEVTALRASIENLERGPDAALAFLKGRKDPYAIRIQVALLLNQQKTAEALHVIEGLTPHERWCDVAAVVYVLNDQYEKAQEIVRWAAGLSGHSRYPQCVVRLAGAMMACAFVGHIKGANIQPHDITPSEREKLEAVLETLQPVLQSIRTTGQPISGLDMAALRIAWQVNHLLQRRESVAELMSLMSKWTPVPVDVARGVVSGYIKSPPDLPERLRRDHPRDLDANILAAVVQSSSLGQHSEAFAKAKELVLLADSNEKKEELFRLFQQVWQNLEGPAVSECETIAGQLVAHNLQLHAIFEAAALLRKGDADGAIGALERGKAEEDPYWLQLRANALIAKRDLGGAVEFLLMAAKKTFDAVLLHKTGDVAYQAKKFDIAVWCYERLVEIQPSNVIVRGNLAHIYTFVFHDIEKAAVQFRALHEVEPDNPMHTFNLAVCLAQLFHPEESLTLYDELCRQENASVKVVLGRAQLHRSLGHPEKALASLNPFRDHFWNDPNFVMAFMTTAHAAGDENAAHDALKELNQMREAGKVKPEAFRAVHKDEALEMLKLSFKQSQDRTEHLHAEMLKGRMPWVWAEQVSNNAIYLGWWTRTHEMGWIGDEPANRARYCIYATNGFHARESERGHRELLPLECPPAGTKVVADLSALITLHRLGLLDMAAEYFGEVLIPAGYLPTVLEDSRKMVLNQRSQQQNAEQIIKKVNSGSIVVLEEGANSQFPIVDEYGESVDHRYWLTDIVRPIHDAGIVSDAEFGRISPVCAKPSAVDETHPALGRLQDVAVDLSTLETLVHFELLDAITNFYRVHISTQAYREILQRLEAIAYQEDIREWHMDLWNRLRGDLRFRFVPHIVPEQIRVKDTNPKDYLPFLASFIAQETKTPLLADDRVCQAFTLNEVQDSAHAAFGTDVLVLALITAGKLEPAKAAATIRQLIAWRYRFLVPPPEVLKALADQYRASPPGQALQDVAEYVHDCMSDPGLFSGLEKTKMGDSMAMRLYLTWLSTVAEFLVLVWADEGFTPEMASRLTKWSCSELLPSCPRVVEGRVKVQFSLLTTRYFLSHVLIKTATHFGKPRIADAMKAMKEGLRLSDDEYTRIVTGILNDSARTTPQS